MILNSIFFSGVPTVVKTALMGKPGISLISCQKYSDLYLRGGLRELQIFYAIRKGGTKFVLYFH